jgi:prevent-host-death family protein
MEAARPSVGVRELRRDLAALVRRAGSGQRIVVSVAGRPTATIGPVESTSADVSIDALVAGGLLLPPRRSDERRAAPPVPVWSGVRLDRVFRELRG